MKKKILTMFLSMAMVLTMMPAMAMTVSFRTNFPLSK